MIVHLLDAFFFGTVFKKEIFPKIVYIGLQFVCCFKYTKVFLVLSPRVWKRELVNFLKKKKFVFNNLIMPPTNESVLFVEINNRINKTKIVGFKEITM